MSTENGDYAVAPLWVVTTEHGTINLSDLVAEVERLRGQVADAWTEGHRAGWHNHKDGVRPPIRTNPYRATSGPNGHLSQQHCGECDALSDPKAHNG